MAIEEGRTLTDTSVDPALRRARAALLTAFGAQGFSLVALTSEVPTIQTQLRLSDQSLQLTVAMVPIIAAVGSKIGRASCRERV